MCNYYYSDFTNEKIKHMLKDLFNVPEVVNLQTQNSTAQNPEYNIYIHIYCIYIYIYKSNSDFKILGFGMYSINVC